MELRDRLKQMGVHRGPGALKPAAKRRARAAGIEDLAPGTLLDTEHGPCYVVEHLHPPEQVHGTLPLGDFLSLTRHAALMAELGHDDSLARADLSRAVFLDTETTGLAGGAGTLVFLVGIGSFEPQPGGGQAFCLRQFFLRDPDEEPAMLAGLAMFVAGRPVITFNGRGFDLPLLETRYILARSRSPAAGAPHLDLLLPSRRLWRDRIGSCALGHIEEVVLGVQRDASNVPGWLIPQLYVDYLRSGDAHEMVRVLYHNRIDVLSMVTLAAQLCHAFVDPYAPGTPARDVLSLARWHDARQQGGEALQIYRAAASAGDAAVRVEALRGMGYLLKRAGRREEALATWTELAAAAADDVTAHIELAKHYEWTARDIARALEWTRKGLALARLWARGPEREWAEAELQHRLERLERKTTKASHR